MTSNMGKRRKNARKRLIKLYVSNGNFIGWLVKSPWEGRTLKGPFATEEEAIEEALRDTQRISWARQIVQMQGLGRYAKGEKEKE